MQTKTRKIYIFPCICLEFVVYFVFSKMFEQTSSFICRSSVGYSVHSPAPHRCSTMVAPKKVMFKSQRSQSICVVDLSLPNNFAAKHVWKNWVWFCFKFTLQRGKLLCLQWLVEGELVGFLHAKHCRQAGRWRTKMLQLLQEARRKQKLFYLAFVVWKCNRDWNGMEKKLIKMEKLNNESLYFFIFQKLFSSNYCMLGNAIKEKCLSFYFLRLKDWRDLFFCFCKSENLIFKMTNFGRQIWNILTQNMFQNL